MYKLNDFYIFIVHDLTVKQHEDKKILQNYFQQHEQEGRKCFVTGDKLTNEVHAY